MMIETVLKYCVSIFLMMNVFTSIPPIMALLKNFDEARQKRILLREGIIAFFLANFYLFAGETFVRSLHIQSYAINMTGGIILFFVSLQMLFPKSLHAELATETQEPVIVPIATPMLSGGGVFTTIVLLTSQSGGDYLSVWLAITLCIAISMLILYFAPFIQRWVGQRGLMAAEQLIGMILLMMAVQNLIRGALEFRSSL